MFCKLIIEYFQIVDKTDDFKMRNEGRGRSIATTFEIYDYEDGNDDVRIVRI